MPLQDIISSYTRRYGAFDSQSHQSTFHVDLSRGLFFDFSGITRLSPEAQRGLSLLAWVLAYFKEHPEGANTSETLQALGLNDVANYTLGCISLVLNAPEKELAQLNSGLTHIYEQASVANQQNRPPIAQQDFAAIFNAVNEFVDKHQNAIGSTPPDTMLSRIALNVNQGVTSYITTQPAVDKDNHSEKTRLVFWSSKSRH